MIWLDSVVSSSPAECICYLIKFARFMFNGKGEFLQIGYQSCKHSIDVFLLVNELESLVVIIEDEFCANKVVLPLLQSPN